jgi:glutamine amidotransferase
MSDLLQIKVGIIDCGIANIGSMTRLLSEVVNSVQLVTTPRDLEGVDKIVFPGVGSFPAAMNQLNAADLVEPLKEKVLAEKKPILGVCLGMQLFALKGYEFHETEGLGFIPGSVRRFIPNDKKFRVPHVGWNSVEFDNPSLLIGGINDATDFYFVHSYIYKLNDMSHQVAHSNHGGDFPAIIGSENIFGVQFHPEKSSSAGFKLIKNFCGL